MATAVKVTGVKRKKQAGNFWLYVFLIIVSLIVLFPVEYIILGSFKTNMELRGYGNHLIPTVWVLDNYKEAWEKAHFEKYTWNSLYMSAAIVIGSIFTTTMTGYTFERGKFKGKKILWSFIVSSMFVSLGSLTLYPLLMIAKVFGLNTSLWGVIVIRVFGLNVTHLYITRSYIRTISTEIDDAAKIDGCSFFGIYRRVIFPLLKPLISTIAILEFRAAWNDYLLPLVFTLSDKNRQPLIVAVIKLKSTAGAGAAAWNLMLAGSSIALIPMIIVYLIFNRYFISGLTAGAVKG